MDVARGIFRKYATTFSVVSRLLDVMICIVAGVLAYQLRFNTNDFIPHPEYTNLLFIGALLTVIIFPLVGLYRSWRTQNLLAPVGYALLAWIMVFGLMMILLVLGKQAEHYSRIWLIEWFCLGAQLLVLMRLAVYSALKLARHYEYNRRNVVIIGGGDRARTLLRQIKDAQWSGFDVVAVFNDTAETKDVEEHLLRPLTTLESYLLTQMVDEVWIALPLTQSQKLRDVMAQLRDCSANIRFAPDLRDLFLLNHGVTEILNMPMIDLTTTPLQGNGRLLKELEDRLLAAIILILISPLMALIAIGVKLSSPGPIFYRQQRVGWNGVIFEMLKFRSMPLDAESRTGAIWAHAQDGRATPFGAFLRRTSLDELPQFMNVLSGEMSIVGPRPERPVFVQQFKDTIPHYMQKHLVKAGITGWAQVNGWRGNSDLKKRVEYDLYYIGNWSLWFDIKIIVLTLFKGFINKNAY